MNFFVFDQIVPNGVRRRYDNIKKDVTIDPALFLLPPDVNVTFVNHPAGIVHYKPGVDFDIVDSKIVWKIEDRP